MRRALTILAIVLMSTAAMAQTTTTTYTGTIKGLDGLTVTSGKVTFDLQPSVDTTISGNARFSPVTVTCLISATGQPVSQVDGVSACVVKKNTSLTPAGTSYKINICPYNACTSSLNDYAIEDTKDITTVVPTPASSPAYTFMDLVSTQTVAGDKNFTGSITTTSLNGQLYANGFASLTSAIASLSGAPGTIWLQPGNYPISTSAQLGAGQHLKGTVPCLLSQGSTTLCGAIITWTGAASTPVVYVHDAHGASVDGISVDCANISGCIAYQYDSNNSPGSDLNRFTDITAKGFHFGFVAGVASTTADTNGYQADTFRVDGFQFYGNGADTTAIGFLINSANAAQQSTIDRGNVQLVNQVVRVVKTNGGVSLKNIIGGSPIGATPTMFQFDPGANITLLEANECEGPWSYAVHDQSTNSGFLLDPSVWMANQFNCPVLVEGSSNQIISIANQGLVGTFTVGGAGSSPSVLSFGDKALWNAPTGSGVFDCISFLHTCDFNGAKGNFSGPLHTGAANIVFNNAGDLSSARSPTTGATAVGSDGHGGMYRPVDNTLVHGAGSGSTQMHCYGDIANGASANDPALKVTIGATPLMAFRNCTDTVDVSASLKNGTFSGTVGIGGGAVITKDEPLCSGAITPASVNATTCAEQTFTIAACSGLTTSDNVSINQSAGNTSLAFPVGEWRVSSSGVLARTYCNPTAGALTPTAQTITVWRHR